MKRYNILQQMINSGVVAVVRANSPEKATKIVDAIIDGGIKSIELTYSVPQANEVIKELKDKYKDKGIIIGAGTVLEPISARLAIIAGAQFIVSPCFDKEVAMLCNLYQVPYIPGVLTPSEVKIALEYGSEVIKLFPGDVSGAKMIKDLKGPFPDLNILPSGGVNVDNIADWIKSGATMVSAGTSLSAPAEKDDFNQVSINAKTFLNSYRDSIKEK
ncbi:bifunctional 4-hydroxy-2-oxoglutarate aldolase/2-dehydro-3-deoxy-phosphogluconate aldolase [Streptococcus uberis]|uniref:KHG/KDPG aldolase [includes: 4-hydroxy-2-oxoglutarate aldolase 2-dehydro-3-deoxy-phosphogluconate aldolase] n=1 Tax=Streptococcus uberis (strain ATCC BAA-854 / 0140J) TaxID=218495 RepID=B9DVP3_STRU0|nr:bifunctional 4-hydroxy-2-oxoglutarate aldolase/2-dehydro-3-deoxy-phosphogluconate aldolase [Streptococcus uberis]KKF57114.1 ketohydroxyglutarate aldolase [Streptococcus uberis 6736]CAR43424.1 putative KHG/KDPG aldolase [includes: 4-hydroxy-2-oxoglutarate aldolase; 2-dehydro-3-deoxy-phosphogluconate aldolase] [Streptococcus uberis 0140J]SQG83870.1 keto-hydroxyglutarate-aldolase/keto-deoxy-phosphogluconate aldolase [Streptococcus uberis]SUO92270.1 keto-hydroxyglutarate-aldolase/keto-deoxy-phos